MEFVAAAEVWPQKSALALRRLTQRRVCCENCVAKLTLDSGCENLRRPVGEQSWR